MQAYRQSFARIYNQRWGRFARQVGPTILEYYESTALGKKNKTMLDLCCGTGQLLEIFLAHGYRGVGIDLSEAMLEYARENTSEYMEVDQLRLMVADAADFTLEEPVGLVVSTYDALNHLENIRFLQSCFDCVRAALVKGGIFVFDLNTRHGLKQGWNSVSIDDNEDITLITRGLYDEDYPRAYTRITGYVRNPDGLYERFEETAYNTAFVLADVHRALLDSGFRKAYFARLPALDTPLDEPETEGRVFCVASK